MKLKSGNMKTLKKLILIITIGLFWLPAAYGQNLKSEKNTAVILIDIQKFYFPGGMLPLDKPEAASEKAGKILTFFREQQFPVVHIKHNASSGAAIHENVAPRPGEKVFTKNEANSFNGTGLNEWLQEQGIKKLVLAGMQTHMCLEATTRAAYDLGYDCTVIEDACATRDLKYEDVLIKAKDVHTSTLSTLKGTYAKVMTADEYIWEHR